MLHLRLNLLFKHVQFGSVFALSSKKNIRDHFLHSIFFSFWIYYVCRSAVRHQIIRKNLTSSLQILGRLKGLSFYLQRHFLRASLRRDLGFAAALGNIFICPADLAQ